LYLESDGEFNRIHILKNPKDIYSQKSNKIVFGVFAVSTDGIATGNTTR